MKELVEVIARALVENPDEVVVTETEKDGETVIELKVAFGHGEGDWQAGAYCKGDPFGCQGCRFERRQKGCCGYSIAQKAVARPR